MSRPDPIQYAERLYAAIVAANFSTMSFLAFGNAVKDGVELRRIPRIAAEPFMRVVGEMLEFEREVAEDMGIDGRVVDQIAASDVAIEPPNSSCPPTFNDAESDASASENRSELSSKI
jgi:hypothetical protein